MKVTKKLLFLLITVSASRAMNLQTDIAKQREIYDKTLAGLQSISSASKLLNSEIPDLLLYSQFYTNDYQDDTYYTNMLKIFKDIEIKQGIFTDGQTKNIIYINRLENEICVAQNRKREHDEGLHKRNIPLLTYYWKSYGPSFLSFFALGMLSKSLLDYIRG